MTTSEAHPHVMPLRRRPRSGWIWFTVMVASWGFFFFLVLFRQSTLSDLWHAIRDLPLVVEGLLWFLFFPLVLGTAVWESSWQTLIRICLVACFAIGWSIAFFPRAKGAEDPR
jgi:hypothetical protein